MPKIVQHRRGSTTSLASILGAAGEIFVDTTLNTAVVHDGITTGGAVLATAADVNTVSSTVATVDSNLNTLSSNTWRAATTGTLGLVKANGTSILVTSGVLSLGSSLTQSWTFNQSSNGALYLYFGGVAKFRFDSSGTITAVNDVIASGTI